MNIMFIQTADAAVYRRLIEVTSKTFAMFCSRNEFEFYNFIGIKRGKKPWHASYNRIIMFKELLESGYSGWVCYADADAFICDLSFDILSYLRDKNKYALIAARSGMTPPTYWEINNGVFLLNFAHPLGKKIVNSWHEKFLAIPTEQLLAAEWDDVPNDQTMLQEILKSDPKFEQNIYLDDKKERVLNYDDALFIKQVLRVSGNVDDRLKILERAVTNVINNSGDSETNPESLTVNSFTDEQIITAMYRVILMREPDPGGIYSALEKYRSNGASIEMIMHNFLTSKEFQEKKALFLEKYES